jgi:hypothetical protein
MRLQASELLDRPGFTGAFESLLEQAWAASGPEAIAPNPHAA